MWMRIIKCIYSGLHRVDKLDHFVPLMNDLNPPPLKQTKYVKREVYVPVTNSLLEGIFMDIGK